MNRVIFVLAIASTVFGCAGTLGGKTRDALREGVTAKQADLQTCYAAALAKNRDAAGQVELAVHVQSNQKTVHQVDVVQSAIDDTEMQACVQRTVGAAEGCSVRPVVGVGPVTNTLSSSSDRRAP